MTHYLGCSLCVFTLPAIPIIFVNLVVSYFNKAFKEVNEFVKCFRNLFFVPSGRKSRFKAFLQTALNQEEGVRMPGLNPFFIMLITTNFLMSSLIRNLIEDTVLLAGHVFNYKKCTVTTAS